MNPQPPLNPNQKQRAADKLSRIPVKIENTEPALKKPDWIRIKLPSNEKIVELKNLLRNKKLVTVCEEASCPNLPECFSHGTATFMIMGDRCTRRCAFCDVAHGRPEALDAEEPQKIAETTAQLGLKYVVITSVDRDDLRDGGAAHFAEVIRALRNTIPTIKVEILVPDFRGRMEKALDALALAPPDVFNHNIETVPRLYKPIRPGSDYQWSLTLLQQHKQRFPLIPTKSGLMVGLGETDEELEQSFADLRAHDVDMLTVGQYLAPSRHHAPVERYVTPAQFERYHEIAKGLGFSQIASGPLVRSSYHADQMAAGEMVS
jgi:lipoic acid synthetase